jgi:hypothetical protein
MSLFISKIGPSGQRIDYDLRNLTIGEVRCADLSQAELFRKMRALAVPGIQATDGHQALLEKWASHLATAAA